ncbi:MAG: tRNA dihydrouridine synthase DusB [Anaerolineae bacterium]|nr:tRNA dihydrouridine synthase DusB [Anaerolineae bacterium]
MAGYSNYALRSLCRAAGDCGLVYTGLINATGIRRASYRTQKMLDWRPEEYPCAVQIYGHEPDTLAPAARRVVDLGAAIVDLNMGCAVHKVTRRGAGAALLRDVERAERIIAAIVEAAGGRAPVTVKIRSGWDRDEMTAVEIARAAERAGVAAIAVHPRTARQRYHEPADWDIIRQVKEAVRIPVIGSGDVRTAADAARMRETTGCDAVMIGRAALGNPWIFRRIAGELRTGAPPPLPTPQERAAAALEHARRFVAGTPLREPSAIHELRGQLVKYTQGMPEAAHLRGRLVRAESLADIEAILAPLG